VKMSVEARTRQSFSPMQLAATILRAEQGHEGCDRAEGGKA